MAISLKVLGAGFAFLLTLAVGRMLGAHGAGLYFLAISITSIAGTIARLGLENTVLRFVAYFHENNDWGQIRGVLRYALIWVGSVSLTFSIAFRIVARVMNIVTLMGIKNTMKPSPTKVDAPTCS